ncbi:ribosomal RNA-processing protein 7-domain-containing protein [Lipomyces kononenkoae]|uniref:Ribosomal RNA-processing protein 7-domain-containing protein n=1 Tax=Lipomyces kononenkoae TaxID=34357 RepID=A0ACC3T270_LIPKO
MGQKNKSGSDRKNKPLAQSLVVNGFHVLPIHLPAPLTSAGPSSDSDDENDFQQKPVVHYLYVRKHETPGDSSPSRTLFIANLPIDTTTLHIHILFSAFADVAPSNIETVTFLPSPTGFSFQLIPSLSSLKGLQESELSQIRRILPTGSAAHVLFTDTKTMNKALSALKFKHDAILSWRLFDSAEKEIQDAKAMTGSARYLAIHQRRNISSSALQVTVDRFMTAYNKAETEREREAKRARSMPDEDGFVTVSRGVGRTGTGTSSDALKEEAKKRQKKGELKDFYRFQIREEKKVRMNELLKNFKMDQEKIRELKAQRRFKLFSHKLA